MGIYYKLQLQFLAKIYRDLVTFKENMGIFVDGDLGFVHFIPKNPHPQTMDLQKLRNTVENK